MDQEKIGVFISTLRKEHGMTQQQLADAIGVSNKTNIQMGMWQRNAGTGIDCSVMPHSAN